MVQERKHWIGNTYAQAIIIGMMGFAFLATAKGGQLGYLLVIPYSMCVGIWITTMRPEPY